jgi:hypothetical protein
MMKTTRWPRRRSTSPIPTQLFVGPKAPSGKKTIVLGSGAAAVIAAAYRGDAAVDSRVVTRLSSISTAFVSFGSLRCETSTRPGDVTVATDRTPVGDGGDAHRCIRGRCGAGEPDGDRVDPCGGVVLLGER